LQEQARSFELLVDYLCFERQRKASSKQRKQ
jgi:hypothetical protein